MSRTSLLRRLVRKKRQAAALHDSALALAGIRGCEVSANLMSREAARSDREISQMLQELSSPEDVQRREIS